MTTPNDTSSTVDFLNSLSAPGRQTIHILLDDIEPDPDQPRKSLNSIDGIVDAQDQESLELFADELDAEGQQTPITVRELPDGRYRIIWGERRWRAMKINRAKGRKNSDTIEAFVRQDLKGAKLRFAQLAENLQREDLTELETATFFKQILMENPELQKQQLATLLKKPNAYISRILALIDPEWKDVVDAGIITYASLLEQFKALPKDTRDELVETAKTEKRALTSGDLRKARESTKAPKPKAPEAGITSQPGGEPWPFKQPQQGGAGLTDELINDVHQYMKSETRENENYSYTPPGSTAPARTNQLVDTGGDATIPEGSGALNAAMLNDKRELKISMDQLEVLLNMNCFDTKGHIVSVMLPVEELRNAILQLGGDVPADDHLLVTTLFKAISDLNA